MLASLLSLILAAVPAAATGQGPQPGEDPAVFAAALERCEAAVLKVPHPLVRPFIVTHTVRGETDGRCQYEQTMPGNMTMACAFTADGRAAMAEEIRKLAADGPLRGSTKGPQPAWAKECEIVMPDGKRVPFGR
jgi:hypothetical protein